MSIERQPPERQPPPERKPTVENIMRDYHPQWDELSEGERGELLVEWFRDFIKTDEAHPIRQQLGLEDEAVPINWITRESLALCRPDLTEQIKTLTDAEMDYLASAIGDGQENFYRITVSEVLTAYFRIPEPDDAENES
ncbi:MAG: hypothetical protein R3E39_26485 [Anaerolineae bacterium]